MCERAQIKDHITWVGISRADSLEAFQVVAKLFVYVCLDIFVKRISRVFIKISRGPIIQERQGMIVL